MHKRLTAEEFCAVLDAIDKINQYQDTDYLQVMRGFTAIGLIANLTAMTEIFKYRARDMPVPTILQQELKRDVTDVIEQALELRFKINGTV